MTTLTLLLHVEFYSVREVRGRLSCDWRHGVGSDKPHCSDIMYRSTYCDITYMPMHYRVAHTSWRRVHAPAPCHALGISKCSWGVGLEGISLVYQLVDW